MKIEMNKEKEIIHAFILFVLTTLLVVFVGSRMQKYDLKIGLLLTELFLIAFPTLLYARILKLDYRKVFCLNKINIKTVFFSIVIGIIGVILASLLGVIGKLGGLKTPVGDILTEKLFHTRSLPELLGVIFIFCLITAVCEELLFRGFIQSAFQTKIKTRRSILYTALLFAIFHLDLLRFLPTLFLGILYGYLAVRTKSIFSSIIAHASANFVPMMVLYFLPKLIK